MNIRRLTAVLAATGAVALGAGTTVFASSITNNDNPNQHQRHRCVSTGTKGHRCVAAIPTPHPSHTPKPTHTPKPHLRHSSKPTPTPKPSHTPKPHSSHTPHPHPTFTFPVHSTPTPHPAP
jgi:hypothetical protein